MGLVSASTSCLMDRRQKRDLNGKYPGRLSMDKANTSLFNMRPAERAS